MAKLYECWREPERKVYGMKLDCFAVSDLWPRERPEMNGRMWGRDMIPILYVLSVPTQDVLLTGLSEVGGRRENPGHNCGRP